MGATSTLFHLQFAGSSLNLTLLGLLVHFGQFVHLVVAQFAFVLVVGPQCGVVLLAASQLGRLFTHPAQVESDEIPHHPGL